jgi:CHAT domain-containing protein/Tfp pilus assembly protein PilF
VAVRRQSGLVVVALALVLLARPAALFSEDAALVETLAAAQTDADRAALMEARKAELTPDVPAALLDRAKPLLQKDPEAALRCLEAAQGVAARLGDKAVQAQALHSIGQIYSSRDDLDLAEQAYRTSLSLREELRDQAGMAETLGQLGVVLSKRGDYDGALVYYDKALPLAEATGNKVEVATTLNNIGNVHNGKGEHDLALQFFEKSAAVAESAGNKARLAIAYNNIGLVHQKRGDYLSALAFFEKSVAIKQELGNKLGVAITYQNIGELYRVQGNEALALSFFQKGLEIFVAADMKTGIALGLNNTGEVYRAKGDLDRALQFYDRALSQSQALKDKVGMAETLNNIGRVLEARGDYAAALGRYQESLALSEETGDRVRISQTLVNIAQVRVARSEAAEALPLVERAIAVSLESGNRETLWRARTTEGRALLALGQKEQAKGAFEAAISVIEGMRGQVAGGEAESERAFEEKVAPYAAMVELVASSGEAEIALGYAERAKARVLLDVLQSGRVAASRAMTAEERERESTLEKALGAFNTQLAGESARPKRDPARVAALEARLDAARLDHEAFQASLYGAHPELKVQRGQARSLDRGDLDVLVPDMRTALLEYVVTEKSTVLLVASRAAGAVVLESYSIPLGRAALGERVGRFRQQIASRDLAFGEEARKLYDLLLAEAAAQLGGKNRLIVVPDGPLWEMPFQALEPRLGHFLIETASVAYAPSLSVVREMAKVERPPGDRRTLVALGNPTLSPGAVERSHAVLMDSALDTLPEAERQVRALGRMYGSGQSAVYVGEAATEERAKASAGGYRVFHVATHGVLSDTSPMYSHLVLSQAAQGPEDGLLEAREILGMDLNADLAVLSACETGRGRIGAGEGVIGLTWAFFVAGCPRTVVSQWKVESASTTELMLAFHRYLKPRLETPGRRLGAAEALRQASLAVMHDARYRHPFYWAGFVLVGDGS